MSYEPSMREPVPASLPVIPRHERQGWLKPDNRADK
jgi:hypothetical protein